MKKVALAPLESKRVAFELGFDKFKDWSIYKKYEILSCKLRLMVGAASDNFVWKTEMEIR